MPVAYDIEATKMAELFSTLTENEQKLILAASVFTDLQYFDDTLVVNNEFNLLSSAFNYLTDNTITKNTIMPMPLPMILLQKWESFPSKT